MNDEKKGTLENPYTYDDEVQLYSYNTFTHDDQPVYVKMIRTMESEEILKMIKEFNTHFEADSILKIEESNDEYTRYGVVIQIDYRDFQTTELGQTVHGIPTFKIYHDVNDFTFPIKFVTSESICFKEGSIHQGDVYEYALLIRYPNDRDASNIIITVPRVQGTSEDIQYFKIK